MLTDWFFPNPKYKARLFHSHCIAVSKVRRGGCHFPGVLGRAIYIHLCAHILYFCEELAHVVREAEKSHDLPPSASWRPRKAGAAAPPECEGLRPRRAGGVGLSPRAKTRVSAQTVSQARKRWILPHSAFCLFRSYKDWMMPARTRKSEVLDWVHQFKC